jgi:hypothetical protein
VSVVLRFGSFSGAREPVYELGVSYPCTLGGGGFLQVGEGDLWFGPEREPSQTHSGLAKPDRGSGRKSVNTVAVSRSA